MLSTIRGIKFNGAAFDCETTLQLFSQVENDRVCLIFGRNGSGKSTVSRAVAKAAGNEAAEDIISAQFVDSSNAIAAITDDEKKKIFVFSEDYTNSRVRLKEDGLSTIVMFGELGDIADRIEKATEVLKEAEKLHTEQNDKYAKYENANHVLSPQKHQNNLTNAIQGDTHWAGRERTITDARRNASVTDSTANDIMLTIPTEDESELKSTYEIKLAELRVARSAGTKITATIPIISDFAQKVKNLKALLSIKIDEPTLSEREKKLITMAQSGKQSMLDEMKAEFSTNTNVCPFCLQEVSDDYKEELIKSIEKVLSKAVEEHKNALENSKILPLIIDLSAFSLADNQSVDNCQTAISRVNKKIEECNQALTQKITNLYTPIIDFPSELQVEADRLKVILAELGKKKDAYNGRQKNIPQIQNELKMLNKKLAYYEIKDIYSDCTKQKREKESEKKILDALATALEQAKQELEKLNQQKKNVQIAVDFINNGLKYVFFSENRLTVDVQGENYTLKSNGKAVKPKNISVGERNILALCYFFTELLNNVDEKNVHKSEYLIVLDDPVSSFDLENRVGIISYLKSQIIKVLRGNPNSKFVILSHDLLTVYDIDKALGEIAKQITVNVNGTNIKMAYQLKELGKREITDFSRKKRNEYSQLLKTAFEYADGKSTDYELVIGNIMRRALEAFGTFEYRKGIDEISCDQSILSNICADKRDYFENLMYRLILNGESHLEERVKSLTDNNFFATISTEEKKRTAKDVLCLIYLLNANHMKAQFNAMQDEVGTDVIEKIEKWIDAIGKTPQAEVSI
jgi:ABC-type dipeptide/oligopeptide/nickel transport system ATPase subunit